MLNDYEIIRFSKPNKWLACAKLFLVALALQLCILYIPLLVGLTKEASSSAQENEFRIRVIANSNTAADQRQKEQLVEGLKPYFAQVTKAELMDDEQAMLLKQQIEEKIKENYPQVHTQIALGDNVFPPKRQNIHFYPQNVYQSMIIKIGDGRGDNWWCNVFPTVCEPEKEEEEEQDEQVTFFIWEWLKDFFD